LGASKRSSPQKKALELTLLDTIKISIKLFFEGEGAKKKRL
jgi:hypothetical protein